jgi:iron complex outermembrane receptor protein
MTDPAPHRVITILVLAALVLMHAGHVTAQNPPAPSPPLDSARADSATKLRAVTVTESRTAGTIGGASAVVVKTEELRSSPAPLLEQALRESPFVHVRQNSRGEMELSVRGSDSRQVAVMLDGVPLTVGWDHRTDPSLIPLTGAQNLVIVRGLASLLNGPNTLGGTVEITHDDALYRSPETRLWAGAGVDEHASNVGTIGAEGRVGALAGGFLTSRFGVTRRQRDGFALASGARDVTSTNGLRTNSDLNEVDAFAALRWSGTAGRSAGIVISGFDAERGVPPEEHLAAPRLWRYPYHSRAIAALSLSSGSFRTPAGFGSLDLGIGYNAGRLKIDTYTDRTFRTVASSELGDERTWTSRALLTHSLPSSARLRVAATAARVRYGETLVPASAAQYEQRLMSTGAEIDLPLGGRTSVAAGVVYDRTTTPETGGRTPGQEPFTNAGWRAGVTHDPNLEWRLHASVNRRSRFPSLRELYSGAMNRFLPNPDLDPETLLAFETGFIVDRRFGPIPDATIQLTVFHHDLDDAIVRTTLPAPDNRFLRINRDRIESDGLELLAGLAFGEEHDRAVSLTGDALVQRIRIHDPTASGSPQRHAENNPQARGMIELGIPLPIAIRGTTNARYTGRQYCLNSETGVELTLDGATQASVALERSFPVSRSGAFRSLRALLALDNATDTAVYDQCGLPQPGRTLRLMLTLR